MSLQVLYDIIENPKSFKQLKEPSLTATILAILTKPSLVLTLKEPSQELVFLAVQRDGLLIEYFLERSEILCLVAVQQNGHALKYLTETEKTEQVCRIAIVQRSSAIRYVPRASIELCLLAAKNPKNIQYMQMTLELAFELVAQNAMLIKELDSQFRTLELCLLAVAKNPYTIECLTDTEKNDEFCIRAINKNPKITKFLSSFYYTLPVCQALLDNQLAEKYAYHNKIAILTEEQCIELILATGNSGNQKYLYFTDLNRNQRTDRVCKIAVEKGYYNISYVPVQTSELCLLAIREYFLALSLIKEQTEELCLAAMDLWPESIKYVRIPFTSSMLYLATSRLSRAVCERYIADYDIAMAGLKTKAAK